MLLLAEKLLLELLIQPLQNLKINILSLLVEVGYGFSEVQPLVAIKVCLDMRLTHFENGGYILLYFQVIARNILDGIQLVTNKVVEHKGLYLVSGGLIQS